MGNSMSTLFRAIVTGFGLRVGSELAKVVAQKMADRAGAKRDAATEEEDEDDGLPTTTADPPNV